MKLLKKNVWIVLCAVLLLAACGAKSGGNASPDSSDKESESTEKSSKTYTIGVTQIVEHDSLNAAFDGFKKAFEDAGIDVTYDIKNAQDKMDLNSTIANELANSDVDLIFANSTPSAQAVAVATDDIPIVFTSVTNAEEAELVESHANPGGNVTGTLDNHPEAISSSLTFMKEQLGVETIGMIYSAGEQNSIVQVETVKSLIGDLEMKLEETSVSSSAEVKQAAESLLDRVEAIYIITDNRVVSALDSVVDVANTNGLPLIVGELDSVANGGLAAYGFEYFDIGYEAGEMAIKILEEGVKPADLPVQEPQNLKFVVNKETAETIGVEIKDEWNAEVSN